LIWEYDRFLEGADEYSPAKFFNPGDPLTRVIYFNKYYSASQPLYLAVGVRNIDLFDSQLEGGNMSGMSVFESNWLIRNVQVFVVP
jgi:hypothetical protein